MSLRARVLVGLAAIGVVLALAAVGITRTTRAHLVDQVDAQLRSADRPLRALDLRRPGRPGPPGAAQRLSSLYVGVVGADGRLTTLLTPNLRGDELAVPVIEPAEARAAARTGRAFTTGSARPDLSYRVIARRDPRLAGTAVLALPLDSVERSIDRLVAVQAVATLVVVGVLALVAWWVVHLGVRPIKRMTETATAIAAGDLSHRAPPATPGTEAGALSEALNEMLTRIEVAFDERSASEARLRRFVADASHELRTPVMTIRGYAELYRTGGLDRPEELSEAMRRTEEEAVRMSTLVDDLLHLARLDQGRPLEREPVDVARLVDDAVRDARAVEPERPITATGTGNGPAVVAGDDGRLRQVFANLVTNALVHTPPTTPVDVAVRRDGDRVVVVVRDEGPGMDADAAARAFERFFRADPSRARHRGGSGLGLSIVEATVRAHGGRVSLDSAPGRGTTVRVELPATDGAVPPHP